MLLWLQLGGEGGIFFGGLAAHGGIDRVVVIVQ